MFQQTEPLDRELRPGRSFSMTGLVSKDLLRCLWRCCVLFGSLSGLGRLRAYDSCTHCYFEDAKGLSHCIHTYKCRMVTARAFSFARFYMFTCSIVQLCTRSHVHVCRCFRVRTLKLSDTFKCSTVQLFTCSNAQAFSFHVFKRLPCLSQP